MTERNSPISEIELHSFVDAQLSDEERVRVATALEGNPEQAVMVEKWHEQNKGIREIFERYALEKNGDVGLIRSSAKQHQRRYRGAIAASILTALAIGSMSGFVGSRLYDGATQIANSDTLPQQAQAAYLIYASEVRHPVEVFSEEEAHLATWLGKRLNIPDLKVPDLNAFGFQLIGGRLLPVDSKPGAFFLYEDAGGKRLSVIVGRNPENRDTSFRFAASDGVETFYWIDRELGYAVSGEISRDRLRQIAEECYRQFPS